jgi:thiol:disulfide interchange protein DsbD
MVGSIWVKLLLFTFSFIQTSMGHYRQILRVGFLIWLFPVLVSAQFQNPVTVSATVAGPVRAREIAEVQVTTAMDGEWHIYALRDAGEGPIPTRITVTGPVVTRQGEVREPDPIVEYDEGFQTETRFHKGTTTFTVPVQIADDANPGEAELTVQVQYQVCNAVICYPPTEVSVTIPLTIEPGPPRPDHISEIKAAAVVDSEGNLDLDAAIAAGLFPFIVLALSMGFLALLTPCVFPMIPITVSYFTHQGEVEGRNPWKQAIVYTLGIIATFSILGILLAVFLGASGANQLAANPWMNLFLGGLFVYFALSLFGMYEIQLPQSLRQFSLRQESRGGYVGTLFMALTFTLTSFTCTVQFVGLLLVAASRGEWFWPALGMIIFSAAFATPFFFLALFPQYLARLPRSGGWLNSVKVVMGFLELAAAFKFFSNTDLVWQWGIFTHNAVLTAWTVIILFTGLYLLGKIRLPHDAKLETIGVGRMLLSLFFIAFGLYLGTGLFGRPIHGLIYSYLPPKIESETGAVVTIQGSIADSFHWYTDLEEGLEAARRLQKPVFVDFTGYTCTNCRWMEANIFTHEEVRARFKEFVLVQLYTDGGENYREKQQYEIERFGTAALPFYVILTPENEVIATFPGMTRDVNEFLNFLDKGLSS